jgi:transposase InsO family protein
VFSLAAIRDAFSNRIVGWRWSDRCDTDLVLGALEYGIWTRDVRDGQLIHHSDKGSNGEFNRWSQHLITEVCNEQEREAGAGAGRGAEAVDGGPGAAGADAVAGSA